MAVCAQAMKHDKEFCWIENCIDNSLMISITSQDSRWNVKGIRMEIATLLDKEVPDRPGV